MTKLYLLIAICLATVNIAHADIPPDAQKAVTFTENSLKPALNKILMIHKKPDIDPVIKTKFYNEIIFPFFDYSVTARLTLGKEQWEKLTENQKERFINLFGRRLQNFYLHRLLLLQPDTKILFINIIQEQNKGVVNTELESSYTKTNKEVQYKIKYSDEKWKIYDIEIKGVSILKNYREQFGHLLKQGTIEELLNTLEDSQ